MKIAYVTTYDSTDIHAWSGSGSHILSALNNSGFEIESIGNLKENSQLLIMLKKLLYKKLLSKGYLKDREPGLLKHYAAQVDQALTTSDCDLVFSPGTTAIAYLRTEKPIVFWADATFAGMINFYPGFIHLCDETIKNGKAAEQLALSKCSLALYTSEWAAETAIQHYDINPEKIKVVPFGANIDCNRHLQGIQSILENKTFNTCELLFIGVDWQRKGGDIALKVAELLNKRGIDTVLHIVGCTPTINPPNFVRLHGFLSKESKEGRKALDKLMTDSHFLIVPSRAECYGLVFAEASSFGVPSLATNVGGIPTVIHNGKNGQTFPLDEAPDKYCDYIERLISNREEYNKLALSAFREYSERLNWVSTGKQVHHLIHEFCG